MLVQKQSRSLHQFHKAPVFSEMICRRVNFQKIAFQTYFGYCEFLTVFFGATMPSSLYEFDEPWTPLASSSESRVLAMRAQPAVGFAAT